MIPKSILIAIFLTVAIVSVSTSQTKAKAKVTTAAAVSSAKAAASNATTNGTAAALTNGTAVNGTAKAPAASKLKIVECDKNTKHIAQIHSVEIKDCKGTTCVFQRGVKYFIKVEFTPIQRINHLNLNITGIIAKKGVPFPVDDKNLCLDSIYEMKNETKCGLKKNHKHHFEYSMMVLENYPKISVHVNFQLKHGEKSVFCFAFPVKLV